MPLFSFSKSNTNYDRIIANSESTSNESKQLLANFQHLITQRQAIIDKTELYITQKNIRSSVLNAIR